MNCFTTRALRKLKRTNQASVEDFRGKTGWRDNSRVGVRVSRGNHSNICDILIQSRYVKLAVVSVRHIIKSQVCTPFVI